jgi:hypothetical protein
LVTQLPKLEVVKRVNSKTWSTELRAAIEQPELGTIVRSTQQLLRCGGVMLAAGPIVVKEPYGVSGVGSVRVRSAEQLRRLSAHVACAEGLGRDVELVVERLLPITASFSTQIDLDPAGSWRVVGIQAMVTRQASYVASYPGSKGLIARLHSGEHFRTIERIAHHLGREGYFGPICVDSLVTAGEKVISLGEINARISMGRINVALDRALTPFRRRSYVTSIGLRARSEVGVDRLLAELSENRLLFHADNCKGVIPLAGLTLPRPPHRQRGRFFCSVPYDGSPDSVQNTIRQVVAVLRALGLETHS